MLQPSFYKLFRLSPDIYQFCIDIRFFKIIGFVVGWPVSTLLTFKSLYYYKYENVCLSVHLFLCQFKTDWDTLWHKVALCSWEGSKTTIFGKTKQKLELFPFFHISLRFLFKFRLAITRKLLTSGFCFFTNGDCKVLYWVNFIFFKSADFELRCFENKIY